MSECTRKKIFTEFERNLLINLIVKFKDIIENKDLHGPSIKKKWQTWEEIVEIFNSDPKVNQKVGNI